MRDQDLSTVVAIADRIHLDYPEARRFMPSACNCCNAAIREFLPTAAGNHGRRSGFAPDPDVAARLQRPGHQQRSPQRRHHRPPLVALLHARRQRPPGLAAGLRQYRNEQIRPVFKRLAQIILRHLPPQND